MNFLVINLKKYFFSFLFFLFTMSLLMFSENNLLAAQDAIILWATKVLPSLFPFFVSAEILCATNFTYFLGKLLSKFMKPIFNVPGESVLAIFLGYISGSPIGAKVVCDLKKEKVISKIEAERLISYTNNSGPLFILTTVGISLFGNKKIGFILLVSHLLSSILVGYLFKNWKKNKIDLTYRENFFNSKQTPLKIYEFGEVLSNSIKNSITNILSIGGFIIFFSVFVSTLKESGILTFFANLINIPNDIFCAIITGIIELTNGVYLSSNLYNVYPLFSILLTSFLLGFGGVSILLQVYSIISKENISIKPYLYGKTLQGLFSILITFILL